MSTLTTKLSLWLGPCSRALGVLFITAAAGAGEAREAFFEQHIRPVLVEHCYQCHSAHTDAIKGGFQLDSREALTAGGESGLAAIVPGDASASRLIAAIAYQDPELEMPPKSRLPDQVVENFRQWIQDGAVFPESDLPVDLMASARAHWAFQPPVAHPLPEVLDNTWPRTEIDFFVLAKLEAAGIQPAAEADRKSLIQRLSFDLLGLPPTPEEVAAFVSDPAPDAYAKLVDRYLASPQYGVRWARHWLDVARYADTKGYVYGREESAFVHSYAYRDWVVNALNEDMPYDQFIRLQLAADALTDESDREDQAAMGYLTLGQRFLGVTPDIVDDRIDVVTRGLMGLTVSCARCHDHKFDPVPTADYYSLYGVFSASSERTVRLDPATETDDTFAAFNEEMAKRQQKLREVFDAHSETLEKRLRAQVDRYLAAVPTANALPTDDFYQIRNDEDLNPTIVRLWATFIARQDTADPIFGWWNKLAAVTPEDFPGAAREVLAAESGVGNPVVYEALADAMPASIDALAATYGTVFKAVDDAWLALLAEAEANNADPPTALPDAHREALRQIMFAENSPIQVPDGAVVDLEWMFAESARVELSNLNAEIDRWILHAEKAPTYAVILKDKPNPSLPRIFLRGNAASPGKQVPRQFLSLLAGDDRQPFDQGSGRREMAEAIASPENPLTARVFVNRVWGWHFGTGLVTTPSDFGTRSETPSHPALLDWLALHFVDNGWSLKALHRQMLLSATYRQQSVHADENARVAQARAIDPENRLLWHFNRHRLDFESLRDALLAVSGELDTSVGGRPVNITEPPYATRRTLYGYIHRSFLPPVFRAFDFPTPDMHSPERLNTTVPQQALFLMNNPFVQEQARALAARLLEAHPENPAARVVNLYEAAYQRPPGEDELSRALAFVEGAEALTPPPAPAPEPIFWTYGYGRLDPDAGAMASFTPLPHFTGTAWQGGPSWPDNALGWAQITAEGGHPGDDLDHAIIRRWTAPVSGKVNIEGRIQHASPDGDGIRAHVLGSRHGLLGSWFLHNTETDANFYGIAVEAGDTIDFVVDIKDVLNNDQHLWAPTIALVGDDDPESPPATIWSAKAEFQDLAEVPPIPMKPWDKLAQVVLTSNEFLYVD